MVRNFGPNDRCELSIQSPPGIYAKPNERHIGELPTTLMCHLTMGRSFLCILSFSAVWHHLAPSACSLLSDDRLELNHCRFDNFVVEQTNEDKNMPATKNSLRLLRTRFFGRGAMRENFPINDHAQPEIYPTCSTVMRHAAEGNKRRSSSIDLKPDQKLQTSSGLVVGNLGSALKFWRGRRGKDKEWNQNDLWANQNLNAFCLTLT